MRQVQDMQDSGEVCGRRCRWVHGGTEITSGIGTERLPFCIGLGQVDRRGQAVSTMMFDIIACSESRHQGNEGLQRYALGRRRYMKNTCV